MTGSAESASAGSTSSDGDITFPATATPTPATVRPSSLDGSSSSSSFRSEPVKKHDEENGSRDDRSDGKSHRGPSGSDCRSDSKSGSKGSGSHESPEEFIQRRRTTGSCSFYPSKFKECAEPRSCFDCLNFQIVGEEAGCMLTEYGRCVPVEPKYNPDMDFRHFSPSNEAANTASGSSSNGSTGNTGSSSQDSSSSAAAMVSYPPPKDERYHFKAENAEYCTANDAECKKCRRSVFADFIEGLTDRSPSAYCLGERGCVCIAVCEARRDRPPPNPKDCIAKAMAATNKKDDGANGTSPLMTGLSVIGALAIVVGLVFAVYKVRTRGVQRSRQGSNGDGNGSDPENAVATPESGSSPSNTTMVTVTSTTAASKVLNLFGWQSMREELINKEHLRLAGVEEMSPVKHSNVQFLGIEPSAPEIDSAVPSAPMAAMAIPVPMAMASAPMVFSVRAMASAPSAPDFDDMDDMEAL